MSSSHRITLRHFLFLFEYQSIIENAVNVCMSSFFRCTIDTGAIICSHVLSIHHHHHLTTIAPGPALPDTSSSQADRLVPRAYRGDNLASGGTDVFYNAKPGSHGGTLCQRLSSEWGPAGRTPCTGSASGSPYGTSLARNKEFLESRDKC